MREKDKKSPYQTPTLELVDFDAADVISTSVVFTQGSWDSEGWT